MAIADQLTLLNTTKNNIKDAIEAKGVTVGSVPFADYATKISEISGAPVAEVWSQSYYEGIRNQAITEYNAYTFNRPGDWLAMPAITATDQRFDGLYAVYNNDSNWIAITATGAYTVDWGDGTVEDFASGTTATRNYVWSNVSDTTLTSEGYRQVMVTVTPQAGETLSNIQLGPAISGLNNVYASNWLDIQLAMNNAGTFSFGSSSSGTRARLLRRFRWLGSNQQDTYASLFSDLTSLEVVEMTIMPVSISASSMFQNCYNLRKIPDFSNAQLNNCSFMFFNCNKLTYVGQVTTHRSNTEFGSMFRSCTNLKTIGGITFNTTSFGVNVDSAFDGCSSLETIPQLSNPSPRFSLTYSIFLNCISLERLPEIRLSGTNQSALFQGCINLKSILAIHNENTGTISSTNMFRECLSLETAPTINGSEYFDNAGSMFKGCINLKDLTGLNFQRVTNATDMFNGCRSLKTVPNLNFQSLISTGAMFQDCSSLETVTPFSTNSVTQMATMFSGCTVLTDASWINSSSVLANNAMFQNCSSLVSVPAIIGRQPGMNSDSANLLQGCTSLSGKITVACQAPSTDFANASRNIDSLDITISSASATNTIGSSFTNAFNLRSVNFNFVNNGAVNPGSMSSAFSGCANLREITGLRINSGSTTAIATSAFNGCVSLSRLTLTGCVSTFSVANCALGPAALEELFTSLGTATGRTVTITGNWGASLLTQEQRNIAINKGFTIVG